METIRTLKIVIVLMLVGVLSSCTKYQYIDTGLANGNHDCTMWEYFSKDDFNWKLTRELIEHAQMEDLFKEKKNNITFLGFTSMSVENYLIDNGIEKVSDLDVAFCQEIVKRHIIQQRVVSEEVPRGNRILLNEYDDDGQISEGSGGKEYSTMDGTLFLFTFQADYDGVPEKGAVRLHFSRKKTGSSRTFAVASSNISTQTGVVHSLGYGFQLDEL